MQNPYQLTQLAYDAGFRETRNELITSVASAIGESGGNERARGDGGDSWGLWQINLPSHPEYKSNPEVLYNPRTNADAAYKVYVEAGRSFEPFHAWSHAGGPKKAFLTSAALVGVSAWEVAHPGAALGTIVRPVGGAAQEAAGDIAKNALPGLEGVPEALTRFVKWITTPANIGRVAVGILGGTIIVVGLAVLAKPAVESTVNTIAKAKPI